MKVAIVGTGSVALATAALLARNGYEPILISVTGEGGKGLSGGSADATGAFELHFEFAVTTDPASALSEAEAIIFATSANRYRSAMDAVVPHVENHHHVLISGELSQMSSRLETEVAEHGKAPAITALSTTLATGRRGKGPAVRIGIVRKSALAITRPGGRQEEAIGFWNGLFGGVLEAAPSALHLALSNLNPIVHIPNALCNFTRMENGEDWSNYGGITGGVARLLQALDAERVEVARAYAIELKPFKKHYEDSFGFPPEMSLAEMAAELHDRRNGLPRGPASTDTRYLTEDVPFGIVVLERLGTMSGCPTPVASAMITMTNAIYDRDFRTENPFLETLTS